MSDDLPLPRWRYTPGTGNQPDREILERVKALVPLRFESHVPLDHPALLYGLALNDQGFFWECHEILEAVWKAAPQGGRDRILLRACIQIANANLKQVLKQPRAVARLLTEAIGELDELNRREKNCDGIAADVSVEALSMVLRHRLAEPGSTEPVMLNLHSKL